MDPDPHSVTDPATGGAPRPWWRRLRQRRGRRLVGSPPPPASPAQAEQDAWVARWAGWEHLGRAPVRSRRSGGALVPPMAPPVESPGGKPPAPGFGARRRGQNWLFALLGLIVGAGIASGMLIDLPYIGIVPGTASETEPLLAVEGIDAYPSDGEVLFTTVRFHRRPNLWEYLWLTVDDDVTLVPEERILGERSQEEDRQFNLELMSDSKMVAVAVALEELGYDAIGTDGVVVQRVEPDTPAAGRLEEYETIVAIDGRPTTATSDLIEVLGGHRPGDRIRLTVEDLAGTTSEEVDVTLVEHPEKPDAGFLGIQPVDRVRYSTDLGFSVDIDSGSVGGPSAGLAFTLAVLDDLTEGELTGGARVAATGTIRADGSVGAVGGVLQKTVAVRDLGIEWFLVPAEQGEEQIDEIRARGGDDLTIVPVHDLDEALEALSDLGGDVGAVAEFAAGNTAAN